jgi:hypothetical protein
VKEVNTFIKTGETYMLSPIVETTWKHDFQTELNTTSVKKENISKTSGTSLLRVSLVEKEIGYKQIQDFLIR